jgi:hypothetical protein
LDSAAFDFECDEARQQCGGIELADDGLNITQRPDPAAIAVDSAIDSNRPARVAFGAGVVPDTVSVNREAVLWPPSLAASAA